MDEDLWGTPDQWSQVHAVMALWLAGHHPAALDSPVGGVLLARCAAGIDLSVLAASALDSLDPTHIERTLGSLPEADQVRAALAVLDADKAVAGTDEDPSPELVDLLGSLQQSSVAEARALVDVVAAVTAGDPRWPAELFGNLLTRVYSDTDTDPDYGTGADRNASDGVSRSWDLTGEDCDEEDDAPVEPARAVAELALQSLALDPPVARELVAAAVRGLRQADELADEDRFRVAVRAWGTAAGLPLPDANAAEQDTAVLAGDVVARLASLGRAAAAEALGFTSTEARARLAPPAQGAGE